MTTADAKLFKNEDLVLPVPCNVDPRAWDETKYEAFLDELCGYREYQKDAIRVALRFLLSEKVKDLRSLAESAFQSSDILQSRYGSWPGMERHLQFPDKMSCSLDLATATGKSYVLYGLAAIMLAEGAVDRVLVLCPSNTIESGLTQKFKSLATESRHRDAMPIESKVRTPRIINASQTIAPGDICVENYHAVLEHVKSSVRDSLRGVGQRTLILNDEAHHVANASGTESRRWKEFLEDPTFAFRYLVGASGTCYVGDDYFADVVYRYSLRQAMEERNVKKVQYVAEMPETGGADEKWQLIRQHHEALRRKLRSRGIRPLTIVVTDRIATCNSVADAIVEFLCLHEHLDRQTAISKVLPVSSSKEHQRNVAQLANVDSPDSKVEWIVSVAMLSEGWDVKNVFQIVPHEERAFNSKMLIAQVLGRGLRRPEPWSGEEPVVTVFNHDAWSTRIKQLVNEVLEMEQRLTATVVSESPFNFMLHQIDYTRAEDTTSYTKTGEYNLLARGYVDLPTQVENEDVDVALERAITGERTLFRAKLTHKTYSVEEVAREMFFRLRSIDEENATGAEAQRTRYAERFPLAVCESVVRKSLKMAHIKSGRITDGNRQRFLQALGTLHRKSAKRVIYTLSPNSLREISTNARQDESCSVAELRRGMRTLFYTEDTASSLPDVQRELFDEVTDEDGPFAGATKQVANPADFKTCMSLLLADGTPERKFASHLIKRENSQMLDAWIKNAAVHFYTIEYAWKKGEHPKRGEFSPDFFLKQGNRMYIVEIKDDGEISDPSPENIKKHQYASQHVERLNSWLEREGTKTRYQFNMLTPKNFVGYMQLLRERELDGYTSEIDAALRALY